MKNYDLLFLLFGMNLLSVSVFSQGDRPTAKDLTLLGLPLDNLDLYAGLNIFQKSQTFEHHDRLSE